jgi:hypothetical protein
LIKVKSEVTVLPGSTNYYGFLAFSPYCGPVSDRAVVTYSNGSFALANTNNIAAVTQSLPAGVAHATWSQAPFSAASNGGASAKVAFKPVAFAIYVKPLGTANTQDGIMWMLEEPNHDDLDILPMNSVPSHLRSRRVSSRNSKTGEDVVLNFHPKMGGNPAYNMGDFFYHALPSGSTTTLNSGPTTHFIYFSSPAGTAGWSVEIYGIYAAVGSLVNPTHTSLQDTRGWDLIANAMATKTESGWVGKASEANHSYLTSIVQTGRQLFNWLPSAAKTAKDFAGDIAGFVL